ncbi:hypothetical protein QQP08_018666 [Theobroma cacao]|nr:hypothetical protein QQP08_018666 [Theobroma cacao]
MKRLHLQVKDLLCKLLNSCNRLKNFNYTCIPVNFFKEEGSGGDSTKRTYKRYDSRETREKTEAQKHCFPSEEQRSE